MDRPGLDLYRGGGAREVAPGSEEWTRLEAQPIYANPFANIAAWKRAHQGVPFYAWPMLAAAVFAISSSGPVLKELSDVPPITLASWRLQLTSALLFIGAAWQWHARMDAASRRDVLRSGLLLAFSGVCLALHFAFWVWSLDHTSLTHSLLLVCSTPVLIALCTWLARKPITRVEILGCMAAFVGGVVMAVGPRSEEEEGRVELVGDAAALAGAVVFIGYLTAGRELRQWMPIFVYAFPVTALAALLCSLGAMAIEGATLLGAGQTGVSGWLVDAHYAPWVVYLGVVPGIVGHTGFNTLLRYLTPLTVSLAFQLEPLFGTLIGWAAGLVAAPGLATWLGGTVVLVATCVVTAGSAKREALQEARGRAVVELENVFLSEQQGLLDGGKDDLDPALEEEAVHRVWHLTGPSAGGAARGGVARAASPPKAGPKQGLLSKNSKRQGSPEPEDAGQAEENGSLSHASSGEHAPYLGVQEPRHRG